MQIPRGFEMMAQSIIKMLGLDPQKVMDAIAGMHAALQSVAADLATIRRDQKRIMAHLGLAEEQTNGQLARSPTDDFGSVGSEERAEGAGNPGARA